MPFGMKSFKNKCSSLKNSIQEKWDNTFGVDEVYPLDEDQRAVADAILASGAENWEWVYLVGANMRFLRLDRTLPRMYAPFGTFQSCAVEICGDGYDPSPNKDVYRNRIRRIVDKYVMIDSVDLIHYLDENGTVERRTVAMIPVVTIKKDVDQLFTTDGGYGQWGFDIREYHVDVRRSSWKWETVIGTQESPVESNTHSQLRHGRNVINENPLYESEDIWSTSDLYVAPDTATEA